MKENKNDINDMHQLAEEGWKQMHEMLRERGLSADVPEVAHSKKMSWYPLLAATVLLVLIFSFPYILNDRKYSSFNFPAGNSTKNLITAAPQKPVTVTQSVKMISPVPQSLLRSSGKSESSLKMKTVFINSKKESFTISIQPQKSDYLQEAANEKIAVPVNLPTLRKDVVADSSGIDATPINKKKTSNSSSKKVQVFAGAGINISAWNNDKQPFGLKDFNIHPGASVIIPLSSKLSLHTGLWAFSTVHGKEASAKERELVNNMVANLYYSVNTTTIVKASYFDVPVTLHYSIDKKWSIGAGLQLSKLYKMNIREQVESFDYSDSPLSTSIQMYNRTPDAAAAALKQKAEIKNYEPRFVAEASLRQNRWLLSAGYYYGLGKTITLKDADDTRHEYRNEYLKLGIQYKIGKK